MSILRDQELKKRHPESERSVADRLRSFALRLGWARRDDDHSFVDATSWLLAHERQPDATDYAGDGLVLDLEPGVGYELEAAPPRGPREPEPAGRPPALEHPRQSGATDPEPSPAREETAGPSGPLRVTGALEGQTAARLLSALARSGKSGRVSFISRQRTVVLRVAAGSVASAREDGGPRLGDLLVRQGLAGADDVLCALRRQALERPSRSLGDLLLEARCLERRALERTLATQAEAIVGTALELEDGFFTFEEQPSSGSPARHHSLPALAHLLERCNAWIRPERESARPRPRLVRFPTRSVPV